MKGQQKFKSEISAKAVYQLSKRYIKGWIIDIGAGEGSFVRLLRRKVNYSVIGIDIEPYDNEVIYGDCTNLKGIKDNAYSTCFALDVLEHLSLYDLNLCLKEIYRIMNPGGYLIINTINNENLIDNTVNCPACNKMFHQNGHKQSFDVCKLIAKLLDFKFHIVKIRIMNLGFLSMFGILGRLFYLFKIDRLFPNIDLLRKDLFVVVRKD